MTARAIPTALRDDLRVGWCPGALRPMRVGDGLLVRLKPRGHRLTIAQARAIAALARRHGNGAMTLTAKANLQLRGVTDSALPALTAALAALGLLDGSPDGEAVRNVLSNPLAGADPAAVADLRPAVAALEEALAGEAAFARLPAKFAWSVDDGGAMPLDACGADIRMTAVRTGGGVRLGVCLAGDAATALCAPADLVPVARGLAAAFLSLCAAQGLVPHRMRDLVARGGAAPVFARAGLTIELGRASLRAAPRPVGLHRQGAFSVVGAGPAFGLLDADALDDFAGRVAAAGGEDIRLTPWRSLMASGLSEGAATALWEGLAGTALIRDPGDPRLAIAACVGAPRCARATTAVPADALRLAPLVRPARTPGPQLHVSGCAKGCAHGGPAPVVLVGRAGVYDLVLGGRAGDPPVRGDVALDRLADVLAPHAEARP